MWRIRYCLSYYVIPVLLCIDLNSKWGIKIRIAKLKDDELIDKTGKCS